MNPQINQRVSPNRVALILALLLAAWLFIQFYPRPASGPADSMLVRVPTKLELVGLPEGQDFEGVPAFFAAFADQAEWQDNLTRFAYWHPIMKTFSYHFEATRVGDRYHFREIPEPSNDRYFLADDLPEECPIRFYRRVPDLQATNSGTMATIERPELHRDTPKVKIDSSLPESQPTPPGTKP